MPCVLYKYTIEISIFTIYRSTSNLSKRWEIGPENDLIDYDTLYKYSEYIQAIYSRMMYKANYKFYFSLLDIPNTSFKERGDVFKAAPVAATFNASETSIVNESLT